MRLVLVLRVLLAAFVLLLAAAAASAGEPCRYLNYLGTPYTVCTFDPAASDIRIYNAGDDGRPFGSFGALQAELALKGQDLLFATNGGMYHADKRPVGLLIENGIVKMPASTGGGWGNFHLLPNGVFYLARGRAGVMETRAFQASGIRPRFATQSGPMLVIDSRLHPKFLPQSDSFKIRNGVGVDAQGRVHLAISEAPVRFYDFATLYRDILGCGNALYLDGTISSLYWPAGGRRNSRFPLGPIIAVVGGAPG